MPADRDTPEARARLLPVSRAKLEAGLRRAMALRPGLEGLIVHAGEGVDMNDVLLGRMGRVAAREGA